MRPFWHPLSTILLADPRCLASPHLLRMMLRAERSVDLVYAGDRMAPALAHGAHFTVVPVDVAALAPGEAVLALLDGIPDLVRVLRRDGQRVIVGADSDPHEQVVSEDALLARASLPARRPSRALRGARRLATDLRETRAAALDGQGDPAASVRQKYDAQASFYVRSGADDLERGLRERILARLPAGGRVLVVGSGTGRECFGLAEAGWQVTGLDFAPAMVEASRREAERRGVQVEFVAADLREYELPPRCLAGALFTYDVYSFVPQRTARVRALRRIHGWLRPDAAVFLSARTLHSFYGRCIVTLEWLARRRSPAEWGDSHTRWIAPDGTLHRSFMRYFTDAQLRDEIAAAGFRLEEWRDAHGVLRPVELL